MPDHERSAKSKAALLESGGRRVNVNLSAKAVEALSIIKNVDDYQTDTQAIEHTLIKRASRIKDR